MTARTFIEFLDDRGQSVLVQRGEVAAVRDADPSVSTGAASSFLRSGETIALQTPFGNVVKRLQEDES